MEMANRFEELAVAYRARLVWRSEAEYRQAMGVSFETVGNNRCSDRDMEMYFGIVAREAMRHTHVPLDDFIAQYVEASRLYTSIDWGDRTQMASRKKFCRMLFRLYATAGRRIPSDELFRFNIKDDDGRLLKTFFPDGPSGTPAVNILLITLFAFGVVRPFTETTRGRDVRDKETLRALENMRELIRLLREDIPKLGSTEKPLVFDEYVVVLSGYIADANGLAECPPLSFYGQLADVVEACRRLAIAEEQRAFNDKLVGLCLYGIWVDDADGGEKRFWIFPSNCQMAYCYEYDGLMWKLIPYEFKVRFAESPEMVDTYIMIAPEGNLDYYFSADKLIAPASYAVGPIEGEFDEASGEVVSLTFKEGPIPASERFDWRRFDRLSPDDPRYERFHALLKELYDPNSPQSLFFKNTAPMLTDSFNNLVGRDNKYLYVYDRRPGRWVIREKARDTFIYEPVAGEWEPGEALFELEVTERTPLYAVPLEVKVA